LHLQNAIINPPNQVHHQSSWHRDLPYQNFVISKPLALSALYCLDDFSPETGGTIVVPHTHNHEIIPSVEYLEKHNLIITAKAGSVVLFDAMLLHKAGYNSSNNFRRAINNVYTVPIIKQQLNIPLMLKDKYTDNQFLLRLLGFESQVQNSDREWRLQRKNKLKK
jgi:ectoine hydroxylase-related dioxygenase (phytanoyl-CoA dioxygenase family)